MHTNYLPLGKRIPILVVINISFVHLIVVDLDKEEDVREDGLVFNCGVHEPLLIRIEESEDRDEGYWDGLCVEENTPEPHILPLLLVFILEAEPRH